MTVPFKKKIGRRFWWKITFGICKMNKAELVFCCVTQLGCALYLQQFTCVQKYWSVVNPVWSFTPDAYGIHTYENSSQEWLNLIPGILLLSLYQVLTISQRHLKNTRTKSNPEESSAVKGLTLQVLAIFWFVIMHHLVLNQYLWISVMISMWHQEEQTASGAVLLELSAESLTLHPRTDRPHVSLWEEAPQPLFKLFSWSLSRTVGCDLSPSVGRAAPRWPLGWQGISDGVDWQFSKIPKECKVPQMEACIAIDIWFLLLPSH